ncbi:Probable RNA-directed DNA polymerase from transposon X-element [Eumeta japonica]|uniref:Probable RNA-directed DNA polymerase from transposon X-element n=1 Tax=Eumeta variegata TaxID=151549 RepID=A0A4C1YYM1_EUMVA|nr:Probable RNA-directed DNA polymerase from transposon X-element [Eumeta japonica]
MDRRISTAGVETATNLLVDRVREAQQAATTSQAIHTSRRRDLYRSKAQKRVKHTRKEAGYRTKGLPWRSMGGNDRPNATLRAGRRKSPSVHDQLTSNPSEGSIAKLHKIVLRLLGPDCISTAALRQLPRKAMVAVNRIFNGILRTGHFPDAWKRGKVITIPKPGKDSQSPSNLRPITLLS